jgi:hypothetical protein
VGYYNHSRFHTILGTTIKIQVTQTPKEKKNWALPLSNVPGNNGCRRGRGRGRVPNMSPQR